ncbi:MAG: sulfite exporter TauE/SafE family protein [bacterium]
MNFATDAIILLEQSHYAFLAITILKMIDWWIYPLILFIVSFFIGIVGVLGGLGGGTLFVPIVSGFFPFHIDFIRCSGLLLALCGSLSAGPKLLEKGLANLRLSIPCALIASISSIFGAMLGLVLPTNIIQVSLGILVIAIAIIFVLSKSTEYPSVKKEGGLPSLLKINGSYYEESKEKEIHWKIHRMRRGLFLFIMVGFIAGMFGIGAGWANVSILNLIMGVPLKLAVGTSVFLLSITDTSAAWVYITKGCLFPMIVIPSIFGVMLGTKVGVRLLTKTHPKIIRYIVIALLIFVGIRSLLKGFGIWL